MYNGHELDPKQVTNRLKEPSNVCILCVRSVEGAYRQAHQFGPILFPLRLFGRTLAFARQQFIDALLLTAFCTRPPTATQVLEVEPWNAGRHGRHTGRVWRDCGERVPGYLENRRSRPHGFVQQNMVCMACQLYSLKSVVARKWSPEVVESVEALAAKLASDPQYQKQVTRPTEEQGREEPGPPRQQERKRDDPKRTVLVSVWRYRSLEPWWRRPTLS